MDSNTCPICQYEIEYYSVGACNHPICLRCAVKLRRFGSSDGTIGCCPTCRAKNASNRVSKSPKNWDDFDPTSLIKEPTLNLDFEDESIDEAFRKLMACVCPVCSETKISMGALNSHTSQEHNIFYCDLCIRHAHILPCEFKPMTADELAAHKKWDATSRRGHPVCKFCQQTFYEFENLITHIREKHFLCDICYSSRVFEVFQRQNELFQHYKSAHFVCLECEQNGTMSCFPTEERLAAHRSFNHLNEARNDPSLWQPVQIRYSTQGLISQYTRSGGRRNQHQQNELIDGDFISFLMYCLCLHCAAVFLYFTNIEVPEVYYPAAPRGPNPEEWTGADFPSLTGDTTSTGFTGTTNTQTTSTANDAQQARSGGTASRTVLSHAAVVRGVGGGAFQSDNYDEFPSLPTSAPSSSSNTKAQGPAKPTWVGSSKKPATGASSSNASRRNFPQEVPTASDFPSLSTNISAKPNASSKWGVSAPKASSSSTAPKPIVQRKPTAADFPALVSTSNSSILQEPRLEPFVPLAQHPSSSKAKGGKKDKLRPTDYSPAPDLQHFSSALAKAKKSSWWDAADNDGAVSHLLNNDDARSLSQSLNRIQMVDHLESSNGDTATKSVSKPRPANFSADDFPTLAGDSKKAGNNSKKANNDKQLSSGSVKNGNKKTSTKTNAKKQSAASEGNSKSKSSKQEIQTGNESSEKKMTNFPDLEDTETHLFKSNIYTPPSDFEEKNMAVIKNVKEILGGQGHSKNAFTRCIQLCGLYSEGSLSAQAYIQGLSGVISSSDPDESEWFSRMIALLPNVGLQRALLRVLKGEAAPKIPFANTPARCRGNSPPIWAKNVTSRLQICSKCDQVWKNSFNCASIYSFRFA
ncbi:unnamed protein product [Rodentolepis nana]|uniref:RING-type domain-containing protein n=1 Tax=Rodentolepis nana TaxID=102285 RepID=A0A158QIF6_RODNA|nr:unnamed protein product [Rodentolepis nana]